jgi:hypothetical protein
MLLLAATAASSACTTARQHATRRGQYAVRDAHSLSQHGEGSPQRQHLAQEEQQQIQPDGMRHVRR